VSRARRRLLLAAAVVLVASDVRAADLASEVKSALPMVNDAYVFLHTRPELGKQEHQAHDYLRRRLAEMGYTQFVESKLAPTAVIAVLDTGRPGPVVALRS
jgi:metal-dependent amidase/aminoacylase/carboxypeptidase family protein